ncbi:MAG: RIP metalloprotease RseP, partial [Lachnospiraceae bacterium]|nr:RIP metalloprotease RseP [Lachnospiraceae bacterium]
LPTVKEVTGGYPAEAAGMQAGDRIIKMGHQTIHLWREISVLSYISDGSPVEVTYERDGQRYETLITPIYSPEDGRFYYGFVGSGEYIDCDDLSVFKYSWYEVRYWLISTVQSLAYMIQGRASAEDIAGPVGVATVIGDTVEQTVDKGAFVVIVEMVNIAVLLSVNLGVLNLLPLPALDGGRLVFLLIEAVRGKRVPPEKEGLVHMVGFVLLMLLMVFVLYNDIMRIIG